MEVKIEVKDPIVASVIDKMVARSNIGIEKYGTTLKDDKTGSEHFLKQLQFELMDAVIYMQKLKESSMEEIQDALIKTMEVYDQEEI